MDAQKNQKKRPALGIEPRSSAFRAACYNPPPLLDRNLDTIFSYAYISQVLAILKLPGDVGKECDKDYTRVEDECLSKVWIDNLRRRLYPSE
ncbi:hypothetical protein MSG28_006740 [Choristoneura fumiferana]|uniref:Uncharacterized protein n=1 Tax=Choristoneura fumiferana TaxID=7141 RepID=A0ACC0JKY0_CHOFU|nr:hypothetical protein MSG28_006740 [Choristoneura fumiferana]